MKNQNYSGKGSIQIELADQAKEIELIIKFEVAGYSDPGCVSGPPDRWVEPSSDEQRRIVGCELVVFENGGWQTLSEWVPSEKDQEKLWELFGNQLEDADYDEDEDFE